MGVNVGHKLLRRQFYSNSGNMPSLWVFLIIVLAILLVLVIGTSFIMHMVQRNQRRQLSRRIARGEVDLEMLGIKKMNVPQEEINKMPQYKYSREDKIDHLHPPQDSVSTVDKGYMLQPTCAICLDDFIAHESRVRELPCKHIYHPDCIDPFLRDNSSLCPLCKKSALPVGFCPVEVTNVMVRRERLTRRLRESRDSRMQGYLSSPLAELPPAQLPHERGSAGRADHVLREVNRSPVVHAPVDTTRDTELGTVTSNIPPPDAESPPPEIARRGTVARREWRRQRIAQQHSAEYDQHESEARRADEGRPWWRRWLGLS